jgi:hypothetical protein
MLSEAKIVIGAKQDEYVILPVTVLATLTNMQINKSKITWGKTTHKGISMLLVDGKPAREPVDGRQLVRHTDKFGLTEIAYAEGP